jgi:hypothetical protein
LAGMDSRTLAYQSTPQRFTTRRARLQQDLANLVAYGHVVSVSAEGRITYRLTDDGLAVAEKFISVYAMAYQKSARLVLRVLRRLSMSRLREQSNEWLTAKSLLIDLYDT